MKSFDGAVDRPTREEADREIEGAPPGVDRRRAAPVRRTKRGEDQGGLSGCREVALDVSRTVGGVFEVLVERRAPRCLLRRRVDLHRTDQIGHCSQQLARHLGDGPVRAQRDGVCAPVAVLGYGAMVAEIERRDQRAGVIGCGERQRLPSTRGEAERSVLELRFGRREGDRELAQDLSVRVQRVARRAPRLVRQRGPPGAAHAGRSMRSRTTTGISQCVCSTTAATCGLTRPMRSHHVASLGRVRHSRATSAGLGTDLRRMPRDGP